jgi:preprotein translocase subunit SecB
MTNDDVPAVASGFRFMGFHPRLVAFQETGPPPTEPPAPLADLPMQIQLTAKASFAQDGSMEVTLDLRLAPAPAQLPYGVRVVASGYFSAKGDLGEEEVQKFAKLNAPVIMWPYMREYVHRVTADARFGPLRLNPVNLVALLGGSTWTAIAAGEEPVPDSAEAEPR